MWSFIAAGFVAGMIGATLAIGGAIILIPVWLKLGVDKDVASNSTASLILISAMVAFTIAVFNGYYENVSSLGMLFYLVLAFVSAAVVKGTFSFIFRFSHILDSEILIKSNSSTVITNCGGSFIDCNGSLPVFQNVSWLWEFCRIWRILLSNWSNFTVFI